MPLKKVQRSGMPTRLMLNTAMGGITATATAMEEDTTVINTATQIMMATTMMKIILTNQAT